MRLLSDSQLGTAMTHCDRSCELAFAAIFGQARVWAFPQECCKPQFAATGPDFWRGSEPCVGGARPSSSLQVKARNRNITNTKMNPIENESKRTARQSVWKKTAGNLVGVLLAMGTVVCLKAQDLTLSITNDAHLEWPQPAEACIVVGANSPGSTQWLPWPEPIFKRFGQLSMATPMTNAHRFYRLVPGTQFIDDFDPPQLPYAAKAGWVTYFYESANASRFTLNNENGSLRVQCQTSTGSGQIVHMPPGPDVTVADFWVSLDILNWGESQLARSVGFVVRGLIDRPNFPGSSNGYLGELWFNRPGVAGTASLNIFANGDQPPGEGIDLEAGTRYRLVFFGVGTQLTLQFYEIREVPVLVKERTRTANLWSSGPVSVFFANYGGQVYDFTVDNFFVTGTKP